MVVEVAGPVPQVDWAAADQWRVVLTVAGVPCGELRLPGLGPGAAPALVRAAVLDHGEAARVQRATIEALEGRLGLPGPSEPSPLRCTVAICTHRRPGTLTRTLESLGRAQPPPAEVLVVDSAPGDLPAAEAAAAAGARYVRVDRPGLNRARRAAVEHAAGDVVVFVDDDCVVPPGWLARLPALFADPSVGAVTGPVLAWRLDTPARRRRDEIASLNQGFRPARWDWETVRPVNAGRTGAGANLAVRRSALACSREALPVDLDVNTPSRSGGDLYLLFRVLESGWRVVYDPATHVFHDHAPDNASLRRTITGYGVGSGAFLTRTLVVDRELASLLVWPWLWRQLLRAVRRRAGGAGPVAEARLRLRYAANSLRGPAHWVRSLYVEGRTRRRPPAMSASPPQRATADLGRLSIVVDPGPGGDVPETAVDAVVAALRERAPGAEVLLLGQAGVAPTRDVVLLWDPGTLPEPGALEAHLAAHAAPGARLAVGSFATAGPMQGLAGQRTAFRDADRRRRALAARPTLGDVPAGNVSLTRATLEATGCALRTGAALPVAAAALERGVTVAAIQAVARRTGGPGARRLLDRALAEGRAHGALLARHPGAVGALPCARAATGPETALAVVLGTDAGRTLAAAVLGALERVHARLLWARACDAATRAAHLRGLHGAGAGVRAGRARRSATIALDLDGDAPVAPPRIAAGALDVRIAGRRVAHVVPAGGQWSRELAEQVVVEVARARRRAGRHAWWRALPGRPPAEAGPGEAVLAVVADAAAAGVLAGSGARVEVADGWTATDRVLRDAPEGVAVVALPGARIAPQALPGLAATVGAGRIALGLVAAAPPGLAATPLTLGDRRMWPGRYPVLGRAPQCLVVRPEAYRSLGGVDPAALAGAAGAPLVDLVERALDAGWVVGHAELPGIATAGPAARAHAGAEWRRWHARGALLARDTRGLSPVRRWATLVGHGIGPLGAGGLGGPRTNGARLVKAAAVGAGALGELRRSDEFPPAAGSTGR